jgi:hypothetical protein
MASAAGFKRLIDKKKSAAGLHAACTTLAVRRRATDDRRR